MFGVVSCCLPLVSTLNNNAVSFWHGIYFVISIPGGTHGVSKKPCLESNMWSTSLVLSTLAHTLISCCTIPEFSYLDSAHSPPDLLYWLGSVGWCRYEWKLCYVITSTLLYYLSIVLIHTWYLWLNLTDASMKMSDIYLLCWCGPTA